MDVRMKPVLTVAEVARLLRSLEGRFGLTPRGVRYYARTGMVEPSARTAEGRHARLYTVEDVVLLRLVCRLKRLRVHERAIWGFLVYRGDELRQKIRAGIGVLVFDDPVTLSVAQESRKPRTITIALPDFIASVETRIAGYRQRNPEIWTGTAWIPAGELTRQVSA
jgi:DNA-binding transcriptional MerR regulator